MELTLTFGGGKLAGVGCDRVGRFTLTGGYDLSSGRCGFAKRYVGQHVVEYEGRNEGDGKWIWGVWEIRSYDRGGFHIWPASEDDPTQQRLRAAKDVPVEESAPSRPRRDQPIVA